MMDATIVKLVEDAGVAIAVCCIFLILVYRNNKSLINILIESNKDNSKDLKEMISTSRENNLLLLQVVATMKPITLLQSQKIVNLAFDYAVSRTCEIVGEVKAQNHLKDESNTQEKINSQVQALYKYILLTFAAFPYAGKNLDKYFCGEWWMNITKVVHDEVYNNDKNNAGERIKKNVKASFDMIENEFLNSLNNG